MVARLGQFRRFFRGRGSREVAVPAASVPERSPPAAPAVDIAPDDPIIAYFLEAPGVVELDKLTIDSPALTSLKAAGIKLAVPLVSQGELIGVLNLGARLSAQEYSADDRALLNNLATQAAPALRVAQLVRQQQAEVAARERIEQELRVARLIQQTLLPKQMPALDGWEFARSYQPARAVGGDFYDFIDLPDGNLGLVIGDVTDKGVPAALVMATTRSILRSAAQRLGSPGEVLQRTNDLLCDDIPPNMFVTCFFGMLDATTGRLRYANAGHDLPHHRHASGVTELTAYGMPLGLMPGMPYDDHETILAPGDLLLLYSDGLVEAHNAERDMFGFPRLRDLMGQQAIGGEATVDFLLDQLERFTGSAWEQEDDITLVTMQRTSPKTATGDSTADGSDSTTDVPPPEPERQLLGAWRLPSEEGNERIAMHKVIDAIAGLGLPANRLDRLKTAVSEATMNAIEHGNKYDPDKPVLLEVLASDVDVLVRVMDHGGSTPLPEPETPNLDAKLAGLQSPRGWGLFLIKNLVDEMRTGSDGTHHVIELVMRLQGGQHGSEAV